MAKRKPTKNRGSSPSPTKSPAHRRAIAKRRSTKSTRSTKSPQKTFYVGGSPYTTPPHRYRTRAISSRNAGTKAAAAHDLPAAFVFGSKKGRKSHGYKFKRGKRVLGKGKVYSSTSSDGQLAVNSPLVKRTRSGKSYMQRFL